MVEHSCMCKSAGVHWHAPVLHIFAMWTWIFLGYQGFRCCKMRTTELILPSLCIFCATSNENRNVKIYFKHLCAGHGSLSIPNDHGILPSLSGNCVLPVCCSQGAVVLRGPTLLLNGSPGSGQFVTSQPAKLWRIVLCSEVDVALVVEWLQHKWAGQWRWSIY